MLWGRCYEGVGAPAYRPWVQAIRSYVREQDPQELRSVMGAGAADIAEIVSDITEALPDVKPPPQLEPEQARFRLFDSITAFLKGAGRRQPLVLILEDLHWADRESLLLLEFVTRELSNARLLVIGTYRDVEVSRGHPLSQTLGELTRERLFQRILLRGLSQEDVERFIELVSGAKPPQNMTEAVYRQTEGNPLFVTEVVRLLVQEGEVGRRDAPTLRDSDTWTVRIPEGIREVIGRRLDRLSERCNQTLTIASVIGREFGLEQLKPLIDNMTEDRLLEVLEEALVARVIEELPRSVGRYQFNHALIQETLVEELSATRRVRLHARIAEALEALYGDQAEAHASELAHHYAQAQTVLGTGKLVSYSLLAGERALASYAWGEALAHFETGLNAKGVTLEGSEAARDAGAAELLSGLGRSQAAILPLDHLQEAVNSLTRAFDYYDGTKDEVQAAAVAETPLPPAAGRVTGVGPLLARALKLASPGSLQEARLLSRHGWVIGIEQGDYSAAREALDRALGIAQREGDQGLEMRTLVAGLEVDVYNCYYQEALDKSLGAIELAAIVDDPRAESLAHFWAAFTLIIGGELGAAGPHAQASLAAAEKLRHHFFLARILVVNQWLSQYIGQMHAARQISNRALAVSPRAALGHYFRTLLEFEEGNIAEAEGYLETLLEVMRLVPPDPTIERAFVAFTIPVAWSISGDTTRLPMAQAVAEELLSSQSATPLLAYIARVGLALIAVQREDEVAAKEHYQAMELHRGLGLGVLASAEDHRVLGLLAQTMGDYEKAVSHFEQGLARCRKAGYRLQLAWSCCDYADTLLARNQPGDREKAMSLLDESLSISREGDAAPHGAGALPPGDPAGVELRNTIASQQF